MYTVPAAPGSFPTLSLRIFPWMLDPVPRRYIVCSHLFLPRYHRPSPSEEWVGFPRFVPRITTSRRPVFRGCRYSFMFRPPSLLSPQIVPTAAILPQGSRGFYVRAYRALLPPHAPDMLTVRIQVIDGTGTFTLSDSQPCRLLTLLHRLSPASTLLRRDPTSAWPSAGRRCLLPAYRSHPIAHARWGALRTHADLPG